MDEIQSVAEAAPSVTVNGVTVPHNAVPWRSASNRHPNTDGTNWGWIEGAPGNVCWSDNKAFNSRAANEMVAAHAQWLEDQKPMAIKLVEARERYAKAKRSYDLAKEAYEKASAALSVCEAELFSLTLAA